MENCLKCGRELTDNDLIYWKCTKCGKVFTASLVKLKNLQKQKQMHPGQALLKCPGCGYGIDDGKERMLYKCPECGSTTGGNLSSFVPINVMNVLKTVSHKEKMFCKRCGQELDTNLEYCPRCGESIIKDKVWFCSNCGFRAEKDTKFCPNCGKKFPTKLNIGINAKAMPIKKVSILLSLIVVLMIGLVAGVKIIPRILVTPEELMAEGNYEKAYAKASEEDKDTILIENLIIDICNEIKEYMKDPSSFELRDVWYETSGRKRIVLYTSGKNSMGGVTGSLDFYFFTDGKYKMFTSIDDMEVEEFYSFDDVEDKVEKVINNIARICIQEIQVDSNKVDDKVIDRINKLSEDDIMKEVELLDDVKNIYPSDDIFDNESNMEI